MEEDCMTLALDNPGTAITMVQGKTLEPELSGAREFLLYKPDSYTHWSSSEEYKIDLINKQIRSLCELPEKWDGEYARPISEIAAKTAAMIAYVVSGDHADLAQFFPTPNGGIQVEWFVDGNELEIEIDENGNAYVTSVDNKGRILFEHEFRLREASILRKIEQEVERLSPKLLK